MSHLCVTSTALVEPAVEDISLCPLSIAVQFLGHLPEAQRERAIPIQITVTLPSCLSQSLYPLISISRPSRSLTDGTEHVVGRDRDDLRRAMSTMPITFLPIAPDFDFRHSQDWALLSERVADWLIAVVADTHTAVWTWGREVYWIAFVGAYPMFPSGEWPTWPCKISLDGAFITYWMNRQHNLPHEGNWELGGDNGLPRVRVPAAEPEREIPVYHDLHAELWARLRQHLSVLHSI